MYTDSGVIEIKSCIDIDYGVVELNIGSMMDEQDISISKMSKLTGIKYDIVKKYYKGDYYWYDSIALAKFCFVLKCTPNELIKYRVNKGLMDY